MWDNSYNQFGGFGYGIAYNPYGHGASPHLPGTTPPNFGYPPYNQMYPSGPAPVPYGALSSVGQAYYGGPSASAQLPPPGVDPSSHTSFGTPSTSTTAPSSSAAQATALPPPSTISMAAASRTAFHPTLSPFHTLPTIIYHEIAQFLAVPITTRCDLPTYITLQRLLNPTFAYSIRCVMKKPLQLGQTLRSLHEHKYALRNSCVRFNPLFLTSLNFADICNNWFPIVSEGRYTRQFAKLLLAYVDNKGRTTRGNKLTTADPKYVLCRKDSAVRVDSVLEEYYCAVGEGEVHMLGQGVEVSHRGRIYEFEYAVCEGRERVVLVGRDGRCWVLREFQKGRRGYYLYWE
ncbi:hypothetical protein HK097_002137 [Rhizophlyctis rosea]|uniref:Uncharacterized protein n=1 Tax=Rhizophlyctis rosea TaxID=64517 RepID=A0AAD5SIP2_9FUNG|nr:hypothetical protein HK097_002137 [Rhizophlyctis rosea]